MTDTLLVARQGSRLDLTMNRPERRNALGLDEWRPFRSSAWHTGPYRTKVYVERSDA